MTRFYWGFFIADALVMTLYYLIAIVTIKKEQVSMYDTFSCYIIMIMVSKIAFTVISA